MLTHEVIGPDPDGMFMAAYRTPGTLYNMTVVEYCRTHEQAQIEADRLNREQIRSEEAIQRERELCGFRRMQTDLGIPA